MVSTVPGDGGSQLFAKLDKPDVVHYFCDRKTDSYFNLWLNMALLVPFVIDCWIDNMRLEYDNRTRLTSNSPGVDIMVPGFGNTTTVEYVDPSQVSVTGYYNTLVNFFAANGYRRGYDIRGAPYDFRKSPSESPYLKWDLLHRVTWYSQPSWRTTTSSWRIWWRRLIGSKGTAK